MDGEIVAILMDVKGAYIVGVLSNLGKNYIVINDPLQASLAGEKEYTLSPFAVMGKVIAVPRGNAYAVGLASPMMSEAYTKALEALSAGESG